MDLNTLCEGIPILANTNKNPNITALCYDSREVTEGAVFFCITGFQVDGHAYAQMACEMGAVAIVCERPLIMLPDSAAVIQVENARQAMGKMACNFYQHPSNDMKMVGITGTNGKTTTSYMLEAIFREHALMAGVIGTNGNRIGETVIPTKHTTPEAPDLQALLHEMRRKGVGAVAMEVSSHALYLHRVEGCRFDVGIFTNLTQDHLDFHKTMDAYKLAKLQLFNQTQVGVINADDPHATYFMYNAPCPVKTFGIQQNADIRAEAVEMDAKGVRFKVFIDGAYQAFSLQIPGRFTIYNALGAICAARVLGIPTPVIQRGLSAVNGIPGRIQTLEAGQGRSIIVDYAHTPDGLLNILLAVREFTNQKVITVFGCGGDRDKTKRPIMGEIAGIHSDYCVITSDNPRSEEPESILSEIETGLLKTDCPYTKIVDRAEAIQYAIKMAKKEDTVLIAGKGHETYQIFNGHTIHFDDAKVALAAAWALDNSR